MGHLCNTCTAWCDVDTTTCSFFMRIDKLLQISFTAVFCVIHRKKKTTTVSMSVCLLFKHHQWMYGLNKGELDQKRSEIRLVTFFKTIFCSKSYYVHTKRDRSCPFHKRQYSFILFVMIKLAIVRTHSNCHHRAKAKKYSNNMLRQIQF